MSGEKGNGPEVRIKHVSCVGILRTTACAHSVKDLAQAGGLCELARDFENARSNFDSDASPIKHVSNLVGCGVFMLLRRGSELAPRCGPHALRALRYVILYDEPKLHISSQQSTICAVVQSATTSTVVILPRMARQQMCGQRPI